MERAKVKHAISAPAPALALALAPAPAQPLVQARIAKWVKAQIITWAPNNCFGCRKPLVPGQRWIELVHDNDRARFHLECEPVWWEQQEALARRALGLDR